MKNSLFDRSTKPLEQATKLLVKDPAKRKNPLFWVRKKAGSSAEIDYIIPWNASLIPIAIKSGKTGTLRSLHLFMEGVDHTDAVRLYGGKVHRERIDTTGGKKMQSSEPAVLPRRHN